MRSIVEFSNLKAINNLSKRMVEIEKDKIYHLVYHLLTLPQILQIATAVVEFFF